jgi:hypothetical protein
MLCELIVDAADIFDIFCYEKSNDIIIILVGKMQFPIQNTNCEAQYFLIFNIKQ